MGNYKIVKSENGIKVLNHNKMVEVRNVSFNQIQSILELEPHHPLREKFHTIILQKLQEQEKAYHLKQTYSLGKRTLLVSNNCEKCLALQFPFSTLEHYQLPHYLHQQTITQNKQLEMDEYGLVSIHSLIDISHAKCCPMVKKEVNEILPEGEVNVRHLWDTIISDVVSSYSFIHDKVWRIEAKIFGKVELFLGISKLAVIDKLYTYVLKQFYNYNDYGIGLTAETAYLDLQRYDIPNLYLNEKQLIDVDNMLYKLGLTLQVDQAYFQKIEGVLLPFYMLDLVVKDRAYRGIGYNLKECLVEIMEQIEHGKGVAQGTRDNNSALYRYQDALSNRYQFIIFGKG